MIDFLYGRDGDEVLFDSLGGAIEAFDWEWDDLRGETVDIYVWTTVPLGAFLPKAEVILDWIAETVYEAEVVEAASDHVNDAVADSLVVAAFTDACEVLRRRLDASRFAMAGRHVQTIKVTWDENGEPLADGEPVYIKRPVHPDQGKLDGCS